MESAGADGADAGAAARELEEQVAIRPLHHEKTRLRRRALDRPPGQGTRAAVDAAVRMTLDPRRLLLRSALFRLVPVVPRVETIVRERRSPGQRLDP
jgi:hypothetical protein